MHSGRVGIIFLSLLSLVFLAPLSWAQAEGDVESIGFGGYYRTNAWTPMKLRLRPKIGNAETYLIQVIQEDIDRDRVMYSRPFTLSGNPEGGRIEERVWVYFIPDAREPRSQTLNDSLKVFLCDRNGKQLVRISTAGIPPLAEPEISQNFWGQRTAKLVLMVGDSGSRPFTDIYGGAKGITEDIIFQKVSLSELPTSVNGYDAVDAIVWLNADPNELDADAMAAIEDYVRDGGRLVVSGNGSTWQRVMASDFAPMLPVVMMGVGVDEGLVSLRRLTDLPGSGLATNVNWVGWKEDGSQGPFDPWADKAAAQSPLVLATAKRGALVNHVAANEQQSPYLARWMYGLGAVIWTAQDFGDPNVVSTTPYRSLGWGQVWNRVFDWQNTPYTRLMLGEGLQQATPPWVKSYKDEEERAGFSKNAFASDISTALLDPMNPGKTGGLLIGLAIVFFVGYWVIAGPGSYFFLLAKKQAHLSWFVYALCALVATGLTVLIVQSVLRGPPVLQHVSLVRTGPQKEAVVRSQFGLYVKQDGNMEIAMKGALPKRANYITPYPMHWTHLPQSGAQFLGNKEYTVPMRDRNSTDDPTIAVPFRSTLKKLQAKWVGEKETIEGQVTMDSFPTGKLLNNTGHDLHDVYLIYTAGRERDGLAQDILVYLPDLKGKPAWLKGDTLNLADVMTPQKTRAIIGVNALPGLEADDIAYRGALTQNAWLGVLYYGIGSGAFSDNLRFGDLDRAALLLSIFERLRPMRPLAENRLELLRHANRHWDASHVVACGHLLIIARGSANRATDDKLPFPLEVEGEVPEGRGTTYYQFVVPMERKGAATQPTGGDVATTQPSGETTAPATRPTIFD